MKNQYQSQYSTYSTPHSHSFVEPYSTHTSITSKTNPGLIESLGMAPKINEILNSVYALNQAEMDSQLYTCSKIVSELLQNNFIALATPSAVKLICYELVLMIAEEESAGSYAIQKMREDFEKNKDLQLTVSLRNTLGAINQIIQQIMWEQASQSKKKKGGTTEKINQYEGIHKHYLQFKSLLADLDRRMDANDGDHGFEKFGTKNNKANLDILKAHQEQSKEKQEEYEALVEQLQQIVAKKQKRIKEITEELQQNLQDQKNLQDIIVELENQNGELQDEVKELHRKIGGLDITCLDMKDKISQLNNQNILLEKQVANAKKETRKISQRNVSTEKSIQGRSQGEYQAQPSKKKNVLQDILFDDEIFDKKASDSNKENREDLMRMLFTQAVSIEALI